MPNKNINRWDPTKSQIDEIILLAYTNLPKISVSYIKQLNFLPQYIVDILRDLADAMMTSYPEVKEKNQFYSFYNE